MDAEVITSGSYSIKTSRSFQMLWYFHLFLRDIQEEYHLICVFNTQRVLLDNVSFSLNIYLFVLLSMTQMTAGHIT